MSNGKYSKRVQSQLNTKNTPLSDESGKVLQATRNGFPVYGLQSFAGIVQRSGMTPEQVNEILNTLVKDGLVKAQDKNGEPCFAVTPEGISPLEAYEESLEPADRIGFKRYVETPELLTNNYATLSPNVYLVVTVNPDELEPSQYAMDSFNDDPDMEVGSEEWEDYVSDMNREEESWHQAIENRDGVFFFTRDEVSQMLAQARGGYLSKMRGSNKELIDDLTDEELKYVVDINLPQEIKHNWKSQAFHGGKKMTEKGAVVKRISICGTCGGNGGVSWDYDDPNVEAKVQAKDVCPECRGQGYKSA